MRLESIYIKNFRNFEEVEIELDNKNVIFGMNDIGKTNFLYALRFLLDKDIRKNRFSETDYHKTQVTEDIIIRLKLDISDFDDSEDTKKLVSYVGGARSSKNFGKFYIEVIGKYNSSEAFGEPILKWGDDVENLIDMPNTGYSFEVEKIFKVIYINPLIDLDKVFEKNKMILINEANSSEEDKEILKEISILTGEVNDKIGNMTIISNLEDEITNEYLGLRDEDIKIQIKSKMAIKGVFSDIVPYIKKNGDDKYYPTSGDGRKKILAYSLLNLLNDKLYENKIVIYLIEEPENSLHRSMQVALSKQLFSKSSYKYSFISTHSADVLYEMDEARLIRIYSDDKIECKSHLYKIPDTFKNDKKRLNKQFCNALFSERVLLIEGPSEYVLFEKVMNEINNDYELDGGYILQVNGIYFKTYFNAFSGLNIKTIVKTDNDLRSVRNTVGKYELLGINRCLELCGLDKLGNIEIKHTLSDKKNIQEDIKNQKIKLFDDNNKLISTLESNKIFISRIDLEHDLAEVIENKLINVFGGKIDSAIKKLQSSKLYNMVDLVDELTSEDCNNIYNSKYFKCLKELNDER